MTNARSCRLREASVRAKLGKHAAPAYLVPLGGALMPCQPHASTLSQIKNGKPCRSCADHYGVLATLLPEVSKAPLRQVPVSSCT